jgi:hypothetical protein
MELLAGDGKYDIAAYRKNGQFGTAGQSTYQSRFPDASDGIEPSKYYEHTYKMPYIYHAPPRPALTQTVPTQNFYSLELLNRATATGDWGFQRKIVVDMSNTATSKFSAIKGNTFAKNFLEEKGTGTGRLYKKNSGAYTYFDTSVHLDTAANSIYRWSFDSTGKTAVNNVNNLLSGWRKVTDGQSVKTFKTPDGIFTTPNGLTFTFKKANAIYGINGFLATKKTVNGWAQSYMQDIINGFPTSIPRKYNRNIKTPSSGSGNTINAKNNIDTISLAILDNMAMFPKIEHNLNYVCSMDHDALTFAGCYQLGMVGNAINTVPPRFAARYKNGRFSDEKDIIGGLIKQYTTSTIMASKLPEKISIRKKLVTETIQFHDIPQSCTAGNCTINPVWAQFGDYQKWQYQWPQIYAKPSAKKTWHGNVGYAKTSELESQMQFEDLRKYVFLKEDPKYQPKKDLTWWKPIWHQWTSNQWYKDGSKTTKDWPTKTNLNYELDSFPPYMTSRYLSSGYRYGIGGADFFAIDNGQLAKEEKLAHGVFTMWWKQKTTLTIPIWDDENGSWGYNTFYGQFIRSDALTFAGNAVGNYDIYHLPKLPLKTAKKKAKS